MDAKRALLDVADRALTHQFIMSKRLKPGEFLERYTTAEEREALKGLRSEDAQSPLRHMLDLYR